MSHGLFTDKSVSLKVENIEKELGSSLAQWQELSAYIRKSWRIKEELRFLYGKDYGWALRFQCGGKLLCALFPNRSYFVTLLIINQALLKQIKA